MGSDTRDPGNGTLGPCDLDPTTDCINFICEANFESPWHVCRKRRGSNTKTKFRDIFFPFLFQKNVNFVPNSYFCCIRYLFGESCSLITKTNFCFQTRQLLVRSTLQIKRRKIGRCKETFFIKMI